MRRSCAHGKRWSRRRSRRAASRTRASLAAMRKVPRHLFVPEGSRRQRLRGPPAADRPRPDDLPALHRRAHDARPPGCAAASACSRSAPAPATRRRCSPRSRRASTRSRSSSRSPRARRALLKRLGYANVSRSARATATAAGRRPRRSTRSSSPPRAPQVPQPLIEQLKDGGRLVLPVGDDWQELRRGHAARRALRREPACCPCASCR